MNPIKPTRRHWTNAALPLVVVATFAGIVVLITLFASHGRVAGSDTSSSSRAGDELIAQSTFHTGGLIVDNLTTLGSGQAALAPVLSLRTSDAATVPLNFSGAATHVWDISPATGSNTDSATITIFGQTPTTTPSVDQTLNMHLIAGTGGAGGVNLSPNGISYMDPDQWAFDHTILAIGYLGTASTGEFEVHDQGNVHTTEHPEIKLVASSTYNTGSAAVETEGLQAICGATHGTGSGALTNTCGYFDATGGDVTNALVTVQGNVILNRSNGTTLIGGNLTEIGTAEFDQTLWTKGIAFLGQSTAPGDGVYVLNGSVNFGYGINTTDHLIVNFAGFNGGATQSRDFYIYDGQNGQVASFTGANKAFQSLGVITGVSYVNGGAFGPKWLSGSGSPEGNFTAGVGSIFSRTDGGSGTALYEKGVGAGNTGWSALSVGAGSGNVSSSTLTANTIPKATGASAIGNSLLTDNTTTLSYNSGTFTVTAASGNINTSGAITATSFIEGVQGVYSGASSDVFIHNGNLGYAFTTNAAATGYINAVGFSEGTTQFRNLEIDDGKGSGAGHTILSLVGSLHAAVFSGTVDIAGTLGGSAAVFTGNLSALGGSFGSDVFVGGAFEVTSTAKFDTGANVLGNLTAGSASIGNALDMTVHQIHNVVDPTAGSDAATKTYVDAHAGGVTSIACGTGLSCSPSPIVSTGTVALANTAVTPGFYSYASFTVDQQGRLTSASPGVGPISPSLSVTVNAFPVTTVNLSTVGTVDWYWYGNTANPGVGGAGGGQDWLASTATALHWKKGGELFRNFVWIGHGIGSAPGTFPQTTTFTSNTSDDSYGVALSATDGTYDLTSTTGLGYQINAPAGLAAHTLRLYTGAKGVVTTITASFDDASVTTATATFSAASGVHELRAVDIVFQASAGTRLRVTVLATTLNGGVEDEDFYGAAEF